MRIQKKLFSKSVSSWWREHKLAGGKYMRTLKLNRFEEQRCLILFNLLTPRVVLFFSKKTRGLRDLFHRSEAGFFRLSCLILKFPS